MYGITSEGTTTDLYTELFGPGQPAPTATTVAAAQPVQPISSQPVTPAQQSTATASEARSGRTTTANRAPQSVVPQPAPVQVAQQPAPPAPPPEPDVPTAYGITANGPTTDLYTAIFGPRKSNGQ